jgi:predicted DNA binding CopG/RHH family protein
MERINYNEKTFLLYPYADEKEFEKHVILQSREIFGNRSLYIDIKKRIGEDNILTIPDGYLIDFSFKSDPHLYIIENELSSHDPYRHIGQQLLKFAISYKASGRSIKSFLLENILSNPEKKKLIEQAAKDAEYRNIDAFFEDIIFEKPVAGIVIIDEINDDLTNVLSQLTMPTDIIQFQRFKCGNELLYKYTPFQPELLELEEEDGEKIDPAELDTIVVPANQEGFEREFLGNNCWWEIRISSSMLERIKYIASYQTAPISAITYYAEVSKIEKYKDTGKYIVYFKDKATKIEPIGLSVRKKGAAPQAPRYTSFKKLRAAKTLDEVF